MGTGRLLSISSILFLCLLAVAVLFLGSSGPTAAGASTGDSNCDGSINSIDAALILQYGAGLTSSLPCQEGADVDSDGSINSIDAALILQFTAGLVDSLPPTRPPTEEPPSDDDLYYEFTRFGFTSGAFFYVSFENRNPDWAVCDLVFYVEYHYERLDGSIPPTARTEPTTVSNLAPLGVIEASTLGGGGQSPFRLLDYTLVRDWDWC